MKRKITFPDWTSPAAVTITRGGTKDKPRAVWGTYTEGPAEWLSLRATLAIAGGSVLFETFDSKEEEEAQDHPLTFGRGETEMEEITYGKRKGHHLGFRRDGRRHG